MDTHRAATDLVAVADDVVRVGQHAAGIGFDAVLPFRFRRGEGMVHRGPGPRADRDLTGGGRFVGRLEQRRVNDPDECPRIGVNQAQPVGDLDAGRAQQCPRRFDRTGREEDAIAGFGPDMVGQSGALGLGQVFGHRTAQRAVFGDQHVGQSAVAALLGPVLPAVQRAPRLRRPARHHHRAHIRCLEDTKCGVGEEIRAFDELQPEPQVGFVRTESAHRFGIADPRDGRRNPVAYQRPQLGQNFLGDRDDVLGVDEAHLHIELGEFGLAVGAEVLVAVAAGDLVVAFHPRHHQQLLEQLRALR
ncbi:Uncharacterised protein [Mycobacterium tuberculosis]|nr:Uncharacterised protein [Mycobacterium tuberculosis]